MLWSALSTLSNNLVYLTVNDIRIRLNHFVSQSDLNWKWVRCVFEKGNFFKIIGKKTILLLIVVDFSEFLVSWCSRLFKLNLRWNSPTRDRNVRYNFRVKTRKFASCNLVPNRIEKLNSNAELVRRLNRANDATMVCLLARFCMHYLGSTEREREVNTYIPRS